MSLTYEGLWYLAVGLYVAGLGLGAMAYIALLARAEMDWRYMPAPMVVVLAAICWPLLGLAVGFVILGYSVRTVVRWLFGRKT